MAGGGRAVEVPPSRLAGWYTRFSARHGGVATTSLGESVVVTASDGATATCVVPFGPLSTVGTLAGLCVDELVAHVSLPRRLGLVLVRLGGHSVGVADGGRVLVSRTGRRQVHGRSAAGGWSQQRFARRRSGQVREALQAAATDVFEVLGPLISPVSTLDAVVLGGDRSALAVLRADPRLAKVFALAAPRILDVPSPRRTVLDDAAERAMSVEIVVRDQ